VFSLESAQRLTDKPGFVREAYRVLRPGGNIALSDEVTTLNLPVARRRPALDVDLVTARAWRQMVAEAGFEVLEHQLVGSSVYPGYRRWLMLTASERRRAILDSLSESGDARRPEALRHAQAWLREFTAHRSRSALTGAIHLREYLILVARRPAL